MRQTCLRIISFSRRNGGYSGERTLQDQNDSRNPRQVFLEDFGQAIPSLLAPDDGLIVFGDTNQAF